MRYVMCADMESDATAAQVAPTAQKAKSGEREKGMKRKRL